MSRKSITDKSQRLSWGALLAIFMLGMGLRLHRLDGQSLWADELFTASMVRLDLQSIVDRTASDVHPPLSYAVTRFFVVWFGDNDFILRLPAVFFGSLSILLVYKVGEILWMRQEGLIGAFLLAVNAYHVHFSQFARHYALWIFFAVLSLIFLLKALQGGRKGLWIGFALSAVLSIYNVYFAFLSLTSQVIFAAWVITGDWMSHRRADHDGVNRPAFDRLSPVAKQGLMFALSVALVGLLFLPWLPTMLEQISGENIGWEGTTGTMMPGFELSFDYLHLWLESYSGADGVALLLFLGFFALGLAGCRRKQILLIASCIAMAIAFPLLVRAEHRFRLEYTIFVLPIYLLVIARGIVLLSRLLHRASGRTGSRRKSLVLLAPALVVLVFGAISVPPLRGYYRGQREDWRSAVRYLGEHMTPGDIVLADGSDYGGGRDHGRVIGGLPRYLRLYGMAGTPILPVRKGIWQDLQEIEGGHGGLWAVLWYPNRPASWETVKGITVVDFQGVPVIGLREPSGDMLQDTVSMLQALLKLLPSEARFDVHLALAEIHFQTGRLEQAKLELDMASQVQPAGSEAAQDLAQARAEFE